MSGQVGGFEFLSSEPPVPVELNRVRATGPVPEKSLRFAPGDFEFEVTGYTPDEVKALLDVYRDHMQKFVAWMDTSSTQADQHRSGSQDGWGQRV